MLTSSKKFLSIALLFALGSGAIVASGGHYEKKTLISSSMQRDLSDETWDFARNWFDGYNVHPFVKIKSSLDQKGRIVHLRDNATGMPIFREISANEYKKAANSAIF